MSVAVRSTLLRGLAGVGDQPRQVAVDLGVEAPIGDRDHDNRRNSEQRNASENELQHDASLAPSGRRRLTGVKYRQRRGGRSSARVVQ